MIDLHFHCLPGIDDGPEVWEAAVALCRQAADQGTTHIVATPHVLRERWINDDSAARDSLLLQLNTLLEGRPAILPGCEFFYSADVVDLWEQGKSGPLCGLNRSSYLLVEFPSTSIPRGVSHVFHELRILGVTPVIAHPERNLVFARDPELLQSFVREGAITQITAASVTGEFNERVQEICETFHDLGLVHLVASDAHSVERRPPHLAAAYEWARGEWGSEEAERIFIRNPQAVIENREL
jgi:protein-tyrosine phosphatase